MNPAPASDDVPTYKQRLDADWDFAMDESVRHFDGRGSVPTTLRTLAASLDSLGLPYAVAGTMAMFAHGFERFATKLTVLIDADSLPKIHAALDGLDYLPVFKGSKNLKGTVRGVPIEFLIASGYPGDGLEKPVAFPSPADASVEINGVRFLTLPKLVELKLASGMSNELRLKDIADVISLIQARNLPVSFGEQLDPSVRDKFIDLVRKIEADTTDI